MSSMPIIFWIAFTLDTYWRIVAARHIVDPARQNCNNLAEDQGRLRSSLNPWATLSTDLESRSDMTILIRPQAQGLTRGWSVTPELRTLYSYQLLLQIVISEQFLVTESRARHVLSA